MDQSFHYLLMINHALFHKEVFRQLSATDLTSGQPKVLDYLGHHEGSIQKDIAYACQIDPATLTGILDRMESKGLIERRIKDGNRRSSHVYMTSKGLEQQQKIIDVFSKVEKMLFEDVDSEKKDIFMETLYELCKKMTDTRSLQ